MIGDERAERKVNEVHRRSTSLSRRSLIRATIAGATLLAASGVLAACGGMSASAPTTAAGAAPAPTTAPAGGAATPAAGAAPTTAAAAAPAKAAPGAAQIRVSVWPDVADLQINQGIIDAFTKKNGKITVKPEQWVGDYYQKLQVGIAGNTVPDMVYFQGWRWQTYALGGQVFDLSEYISRDKNQLPADLYPDVDAYTRQLALKGKHYGVPVDTGSMVMYYNKDLFDAAGVPYPKDDWTYDDWLSTVQKVQDGLKKANKDGVFAYQPNYNDPYVRDFPWWRMTGALEFDQLENPKTAKWTDPAIVSA